MFPLLVGGAALLAAIGLVEADLRRRKLLPLDQVFARVSFKGVRPPAHVVEQVEEALASLLVVVPGLFPVLVDLELVMDSGRAGGWYLPETKRIVIGWKEGKVGLVTHEAFHALDHATGLSRGKSAYATWQPDLPHRALAEEARDLLLQGLDEYSDRVVLDQIRILPEALRRRLVGRERVPVMEAVQIVLDRAGRSDLDPGDVIRSLQEAKGPLGGFDGPSIEREYGPELAPMLVQIGISLPVGTPLSILSKGEEVVRRYYDSVGLDQRLQNSRGYYRSLHEVWARLADQSLRRAAELHGLWLPEGFLAPELEMTEEGLMLLEPRLWELVRR